jgi:hypothetical protein
VIAIWWEGNDGDDGDDGDGGDVWRRSESVKEEVKSDIFYSKSALSSSWASAKKGGPVIKINPDRFLYLRPTWMAPPGFSTAERDISPDEV